MTLNDYQKAAMNTCMASSENIHYMAYGLAGEVGELTGKLAKLIRKDYIEFDHFNNYCFTSEAMVKLGDKGIKELEDGLLGELGDVAWMLAGLCHVMGYTLEQVCQANIDKLADRKRRGVIDGNGDNR